MGRKLINIVGLRFGRLTVQSYTGDKYRRWTCLCDCGNTIDVPSGRLKLGSTKSCGCINTRYSMCGTPTYRSWSSMIQRCTNDKNSNYYKYGAVGTEIDARWVPSKGGSFENFLEDMGLRPEGTSLNRINSVSLYSKETCEWANMNIQSYDQRIRKDNNTGIAGVRWRKDKSVYEARISKDGTQYLLYYGTSLEEAIKARQEAELRLYGEIKSVRKKRSLQMSDLKAKVKELLASASSDIKNSFFNSEFDEEISKYDEEEDVAFKTALRESGLTVERVDRYGGEDMGSEYWSIYEFSKGEYSVLVKFNGWYQSYNGSEFDEWYFAKAVPKSGFNYIEE